MRMLIMGAPGAGKGTQAKLIANHYRIPAVSTGAIFRANIAAKTPLGQRVDQLISGGEFVPDVITTAVVAKRLLEPDAANGWLLDGYPRTTEQVEALDIILEDAKRHLDCVLCLDTDEETLIDRLVKRAAIEGRADDNEQTIRRRMEVYREETAPLLAIYEERKLLVRVDGEGTVDEVAERIFAAIDSIASK
ncbi:MULTISPECIES: adenylate kinase [unclassified Luteococcus]|uniref:adenylate kinase n=1 Tax=unclassified Luteococcus TaxID=2639923 RepID=UPI00313BAE40